MIRDWLLISIAIAGLWAFWGVLKLVFVCVDYWQAARRGEVAQALKGKGS